MPKVSIIMGVFNEEDTVGRAIESIIDQSFTDWEFIICDDGSTDNTMKILKEYASIDSRIKIIKNERNLGVASARNKCIEVSSGEYIAIQDSDDFSHTERIKKQIEFLDDNEGFDFVGCRAMLFDSEGVWGTRGGKIKVPEAHHFLWGPPFIHPSMMFRKKALLQVQCYRIAKETYRSQDYDLYMRMYALGMKGANISDALCFYYEGRDSYKKRKYRYRIDEVKIRYKGFKRLGIIFPTGWLYVLKPLVVGLIPSRLMVKYRTKKNAVTA